MEEGGGKGRNATVSLATRVANEPNDPVNIYGTLRAYVTLLTVHRNSRIGCYRFDCSRIGDSRISYRRSPPYRPRATPEYDSAACETNAR